MTATLLIEQVLNGLQFGTMLFLMAAGLTLVFGVMGLINLAHGSLYMVGAFAAATAAAATGNFLLALVAALAAAALAGALVEMRRPPPPLPPRPPRPGPRHLRPHPDLLRRHPLALRLLPALPRRVRKPFPAPSTSAPSPTPLYRLAIIVVGIAVAVGLWLLINRTRLGVQIRAGEADREMIAALGIDIARLYTIVFALGAALAGLAGALIGPIQSVQVGMGEPVLIMAFVVVVIGGIGSIKGALVGAILVGLTDTLGRFLFPVILGAFTDPSSATAIGSALASMSIYILMALILVWRPTGLMGAH